MTSISGKLSLFRAAKLTLSKLIVTKTGPREPAISADTEG